MNKEVMICPYCAEEVNSNALVCKHCNAKLKEKCKKCEKVIDVQSSICEFCGHKRKYRHMREGDVYKSKGVAIFLSIFLGSFGAHKFYVGKNGVAVIYLITCWTFVPLFVSLIEAVVFLSFDERQWTNYVNDRPIRS